MSSETALNQYCRATLERNKAASDSGVKRCGNTVQQHPVSEAIFNFAGAWSFMLLPLFIWDRKSKRKVGMWTAILVSILLGPVRRPCIVTHT